MSDFEKYTCNVCGLDWPGEPCREDRVGKGVAVLYCVRCAIKEFGAEVMIADYMAATVKLKRHVALLRGTVNHAYTGLRKSEFIDGIEIMLKMAWDETAST